jgi:RES domain
VEPVAVPLPARHHWLRVADEAWADPLDPTFAEQHGGRWNPPGSYPTLYLNQDLATAKAQVHRLLAGWPVDPEDLDPPWVLVTAELPLRQRAADARTDAGLAALGLPPTYPGEADGSEIPHVRCQAIGATVHEAGLHGVWCRSAATPDGSGRELAWFPRPGARARPVGRPVPFPEWWSTPS